MLTSTQIGAIGENLLVNAVMKYSDGRLSGFRPVADDDGIDVLFFDKKTGNSIAIQLKCRTKSLKKKNAVEPGNNVHFEVKNSKFTIERRIYLVGALINEDFNSFSCTWLFPMKDIPNIARKGKDKYIVRPSRSQTSKDKFISYRCSTLEELAKRLIIICES